MADPEAQAAHPPARRMLEVRASPARRHRGTAAAVPNFPADRPEPSGPAPPAEADLVLRSHDVDGLLRRRHLRFLAPRVPTRHR